MPLTNDYEAHVNKLYESLDKFQELEPDNEEFSKHFKKWNFFDYDDTLAFIDGVNPASVRLNNPGVIFLYEKYKSKWNGQQERIYYPKIGIYINGIPCDQTVEVEWVNLRRNWEYNRKYQYTDPQGETKEYDFCYLATQVQSLPIWGDDLLIYGVWDKLPGWKELKKHYQRTWWFHKTIEKQRDIMINQLLNINE